MVGTIYYRNYIFRPVKYHMFNFCFILVSLYVSIEKTKLTSVLQLINHHPLFPRVLANNRANSQIS